MNVGKTFVTRSNSCCELIAFHSPTHHYNSIDERCEGIENSVSFGVTRFLDGESLLETIHFLLLQTIQIQGFALFGELRFLVC